MLNSPSVDSRTSLGAEKMSKSSQMLFKNYRLEEMIMLLTRFSLYAQLGSMEASRLTSKKIGVALKPLIKRWFIMRTISLYLLQGVLVPTTAAIESN